MGLLDQALALDLRRPQDYYHRLWNLSFRATDLAARAARSNNRFLDKRIAGLEAQLLNTHIST